MQKDIQESLADPFKKGRREIMLELQKTQANLGSFFEELPDAIPRISIEQLMANLIDQAEFQRQLQQFMTTAGALGLDSLVAQLGTLSPAEWQTLFDMGLSIAQIIQLGIAAGDVTVPVSGHIDYNTGTWTTGPKLPPTIHWGTVPNAPLPPPVPEAMGGPVSAGRSYLVGEQGPELFVPGASGKIVPNNRLAVGTTYAPTVHVHVAGSVIAERELARIIEDQLVRSYRRGATSEVF
jgi:hypothetical protein